MVKKITLFLSALVVALTASAEVPAQPKLHNLVKNDCLAKKVESGKAVSTNLKLNEKLARTKRLQGKTAIPPGAMIDQVPSGTIENYSRNCIGWFEFYELLFSEEVEGYVQKVIEGDDNIVYINGGVTQFPLFSNWVKGSKDASGNIVIPSGQIVYEERDGNELYQFGLVAIKLNIDYNAGEITNDVLPELTLTYQDGKYVCDTPDVVWALCEYDEAATWGSEWLWTGYGDERLEIVPMTKKPVVVPDGVEFEKWSLISESNGSARGYFVEVGFSDSDVYLGGLVKNSSDYYVKGTIENNIVTIAAGQLVGEGLYNCWNFAYGGTIESVWDDDYEEYVDMPVVTGDIKLIYDAENKKLTSESPIIFCVNAPENLEDANPESVLYSATIVYQQRDPEALPAKPHSLVVEDWWEDYGTNDFSFLLPPFDENGCLLDISNLYYKIYINDEVYKFSSDLYADLPEDGVEELNCKFTNQDDIWVSGNGVLIYFYIENLGNIGVQSIYYDSDANGKPIRLMSDIVRLDDSKVPVISADVKNSTYYDLYGRKVVGNAPGIYLRKDVMSDGSTKTTKIVVK